MTELSGYDAEFMEPPKELQFDCSICLSILRDPFIVNCCGNSFCFRCIKPIVDAPKSQCPLCKGSPKPLAEDKRLKRDLFQKKVYCSNKKFGCGWTGLLAEYDTHLNIDPKPPRNRLEGCLFVKIECLYNCDSLYSRGEIGYHEENCPQKPYMCEFCNKFTGTKYILSNHHYGVCEKHPVDCSNDCGVRFPRFQLNSHLVNDCLLTTVNCDYQYAGCDAWLMRRDLEDHLIRNAKKHASLLDTENKALMCDIQKLEIKLGEVVIDCTVAMEDKETLAKENVKLMKKAKVDESELTELFEELTWREAEIKKVAKYSDDLMRANAVRKEKDQQLSILRAANMKLVERITKLERYFDEAVMEKTKKQSLLEDFDLKTTTLQSEMSEYHQKLEDMAKEMEAVKKQNETELANKDLEVEKDRRMITKLEKKLKKEQKEKPRVYDDTDSANKWPPLEDFDPYRECSPPFDDDDEFVPYSTFHEQRSKSSNEISPAHVKNEGARAFPLTAVPVTTVPLTMPQASKSDSPPLSYPTHPEAMSWVQVVKKPRPSRSNPILPTNRTQTPITKSKSLPHGLPKKQHKLMIRNTPSRNRGATDEEIFKYFSRFGRIYHVDRQGSNTALIYDNMASVTRGVEESRRGKLVCRGVILNCTRAFLSA